LRRTPHQNEAGQKIGGGEQSLTQDGPAEDSRETRILREEFQHKSLMNGTEDTTLQHKVKIGAQ
jgi:hypothetical protein